MNDNNHNHHATDAHNKSIPNLMKTPTTLHKYGNNAMRSASYYESLACDELSDMFC